ncbi:Hypothetical protein A7982_01096 [Minicystis rosea]|nr:Hypothetical protein A7982_01096 [Minicystis rosea]
MASRLWSNPPLNQEGLLDYSQLTIAEIHEDLVETLSDLVFNAGKVYLNSFRLRLEADDVWKRVRSSGARPPEAIIRTMEELRRLLERDTYLRTAEATRLLGDLAETFEAFARGSP